MTRSEKDTDRLEKQLEVARRARYVIRSRWFRALTCAIQHPGVDLQTCTPILGACPS